MSTNSNPQAANEEMANRLFHQHHIPNWTDSWSQVAATKITLSMQKETPTRERAFLLWLTNSQPSVS